MNKLVLVFLTQFTVLSILYGQDSNWIVYNTSNSPLSDNHIEAIDVDSKGNLWIGTVYSGLYKFDGSEWTNFTTGNSNIHTNYPTAIHCDINDNVWLTSGWGKGQISQFNGEEWVTHDAESSNGIIFDPAPNNDISSDSNGVVYVAAWSSILKYVENKWTRIPKLPQYESYYFIKTDHNSHMWLANSDGVYFFNGDTIIDYNVANSNIPSSDILSLEIDRVGNVWITTEHDGAAFFDGFEWNVLNLDNSSIPFESLNEMTIDINNNKWFSTGTRWGTGIGLIMYDNTTWTQIDKQNSNLPSHQTWNLTIDKNNNLWIGTYNKGIAVYNKNGISFSKSKNHSIYPNPFNDNLKIEIKKNYTDLISIILINQFGQSVFKRDYSDYFGTIELDMSFYPSGIYLISIEDVQGGRSIKKIVKQ